MGGYSRKNMLPVDVLAFEFQVEDTHDPQQLESAPEQGIYVHGVFMDGAAWDYEDKVICSQDFGVMFVRAPIFNLIIVQGKEANAERHSMPLYKTSVRAGTRSTTECITWGSESEQTNLFATRCPGWKRDLNIIN